MAHPKRRHSHSRTRKKRNQKKLKTPTLVLCPQCKNPRPPHMVCHFCGYYRGREVILIERKKKKEKKR